MKTMNYGNVMCKVNVTEQFYFNAEIPCEYGRDAVAYAVERYFASCGRPDARAQQTELCRRCTYASWRQRTAKGTPPKEHHVYTIPARRMELPGKWVRVTGDIDKYGFTVDRVELLRRLSTGNPETDFPAGSDRGEALYEEAVDPLNSGRKYIETDEGKAGSV